MSSDKLKELYEKVPIVRGALDVVPHYRDIVSLMEVMLTTNSLPCISLDRKMLEQLVLALEGAAAFHTLLVKEILERYKSEGSEAD